MEFGQRSPARLAITVYSRLHLTLLAMHFGEYRINGGIGFAIAEPTGELAISEAPSFKINDQRSDPLSCDEKKKLISILQTEQVRHGFKKALSIFINGSMRTHSGFGSGTAISLACLEALHYLNNSTASPSELISASGRGGTSGIGIQTYFSGGYVFDLGRSTLDNLHVPSHRANSSHLPLVVDCQSMPEWDVGVCIPAIMHKSQDEEQDFFERTCPLPSVSAYEAIYHSLFGVYAAIREKNLTTFGQALRSIQNCSWKMAERSEYGDALIRIETALYEFGAEAVGMSSLGPSLFFVGQNVGEVVRKMQAAHPECECFLTRPINTGRSFRND